MFINISVWYKRSFHTIYRLLHRIFIYHTFNKQSLRDVIGKVFGTFITIANFERYFTIYSYRSLIEKNLWSMETRSVYCRLKWRMKIPLAAANSNPCIDRTYRTVSLECLDYPSNAQAICTIFKYYVSIVTRLVRVLSVCNSELRTLPSCLS